MDTITGGSKRKDEKRSRFISPLELAPLEISRWMPLPSSCLRRLLGECGAEVDFPLMAWEAGIEVARLANSGGRREREGELELVGLLAGRHSLAELGLFVSLALASTLRSAFELEPSTEVRGLLVNLQLAFEATAEAARPAGFIK